jgi:NhaP-type Na+/H+ or K+/H+ antiporter
LQKIRPADDVMEDFVALATILLTYSLTELVNGYGFLAVFVAGVVVQRNYFCQQDKRLAQLEFTEQIEKLIEVATILLIGSVLLWEPMLEVAVPAVILAVMLFAIIRPVGVWISTIGMKMPRHRRLLFGWFGVRGVGSVYYLTYAMGKGIGGDQVEVISWIVFTVVVLSILIHGISARPLMNNYEKSLRRKRRPQQSSFPVEPGK